MLADQSNPLEKVKPKAKLSSLFYVSINCRIGSRCKNCIKILLRGANFRTISGFESFGNGSWLYCNVILTSKSKFYCKNIKMMHNDKERHRVATVTSIGEVDCPT